MRNARWFRISLAWLTLGAASAVSGRGRAFAGLSSAQTRYSIYNVGPIPQRKLAPQFDPLAAGLRAWRWSLRLAGAALRDNAPPKGQAPQ